MLVGRGDNWHNRKTWNKVFVSVEKKSEAFESVVCCCIRKKMHGRKVEEEEHNNNSSSIIRKGPWKREEDEVLLNHVKKYGPRDWSSIRSKGLLQRTGKSCRLRWVNKLRPNLKK